MENYLSKLTEPYVGEVKVPDFNQIRQNALATAAAEGQFQDQEYKRYSRNYLNGLLANNPNASGDEIGNALAQGGVGAEAIPYRYNWLNQQQAQLKFDSDLRKEVALIMGNVGDESSKRSSLDYLASRFPGEKHIFEPFYPMPWQQARQVAEEYSMGPEVRARLQLAQNADQRAANQDARAANQDAREQELQPGKVALQGAQANYYGARTDRAQREKPIMMEVENDWPPKKVRVPARIQTDENGNEYLAPIPQQGAQGQQPQAPQQGAQGQPPVPGAQQRKSDGKWFIQKNGQWYQVN